MSNSEYSQIRTQHKALSSLLGTTLPVPPHPTAVSGMLAWWDFSDVSSLFTGTYADRLTSTTNPTTNLDPLCRANDLSGNGNHLLCFSDATRATYALSATLNGRTGSNLGRWDRPSFGGTVKTWFVVHKYDGSTPAYAELCNNQASKMSLAIGSAVSNRLSFVRDNVAWLDSGFTPGTSARVYRVLYNGSTSSYWTASGGTETLRQTTGLIGDGSPGPLAIRFPGQLYEVLVYDSAVSGANLAAIHTYLNTKWGV